MIFEYKLGYTLKKYILIITKTFNFCNNSMRRLKNSSKENILCKSFKTENLC